MNLQNEDIELWIFLWMLFTLWIFSVTSPIAILVSMLSGSICAYNLRISKEGGKL